MAITPFAFSPVDGLLNTTTYPQKPANQTAARTQLQDPHEQEKNYINNTLLPGIADISGWTLSLATFSYTSADSPTFVMASSVDVTANFYPATKVRLTQDAIIKYFIVMASLGTAITLYGGTDFTLTSSPITNVNFSTVKAPFGFPLDPNKWSIIATVASDNWQSSPTQNTWYNQLQLLFPIGAWFPDYSAILEMYKSSVGNLSCYVTLSTANNSESDITSTSRISTVNISGTIYQGSTISLRLNPQIIASKTVKYLNIRTIEASVSGIIIHSNSFIRILCAYL